MIGTLILSWVVIALSDKLGGETKENEDLDQYLETN